MIVQAHIAPGQYWFRGHVEPTEALWDDCKEIVSANSSVTVNEDNYSRLVWGVQNSDSVSGAERDEDDGLIGHLITDDFDVNVFVKPFENDAAQVSYIAWLDSKDKRHILVYSRPNVQVYVLNDTGKTLRRF